MSTVDSTWPVHISYSGHHITQPGKCRPGIGPIYNYFYNILSFLGYVHSCNNPIQFTWFIYKDNENSFPNPLLRITNTIIIIFIFFILCAYWYFRYKSNSSRYQNGLQLLLVQIFRFVFKILILNVSVHEFLFLPNSFFSFWLKNQTLLDYLFFFYNTIIIITLTHFILFLIGIQMLLILLFLCPFSSELS